MPRTMLLLVLRFGMSVLLLGLYYLSMLSPVMHTAAIGMFQGYARRLQTVMQEAGLRLPKQQQVETSGDEQRAEVLNVTSFDQLSAVGDADCAVW